MSKFIKTITAVSLLVLSSLALAESYPNVGRPATEKEIAAWDIDVRPDFKGLPKGSGTVAKGMQVWEGKCASCHGSFGESNEVFTPIVGGTTREDIKTGRVAALRGNAQPQRTTIMKVATVSTLWDYINRAMPWTAPKSLTTEEVYAVTAYILNMAEILPDDFTLSDKNIPEVQNLMPNRNGMTMKHGMWDVKGKPDVQSVACMKNCPTQAQLRSTLPAAARNVHGNISQQNRPFGAVRGVDTSMPAVTGPIVGKRTDSVMLASTSAKNTPPTAPSADGVALAKKNNCMACHGISNKVIGPGFTEIATRYKGDLKAEPHLFDKVKNGGGGTWGPIPMPAQSHVRDDEIKAILSWILKGAK